MRLVNPQFIKTDCYALLLLAGTRIMIFNYSLIWVFHGANYITVYLSVHQVSDQIYNSDEVVSPSSLQSLQSLFLTLLHSTSHANSMFASVLCRHLIIETVPQRKIRASLVSANGSSVTLLWIHKTSNTVFLKW